MAKFPIFLSVVMVARNEATSISADICRLVDALQDLVQDFEVVVVDNASTDETLGVLRKETQSERMPNVQVFGLTKAIDANTAIWVGLENALGDYAVVYDQHVDDLAVLPQMLEACAEGAEVVFSRNENQVHQGLLYRLGARIFNAVFKAASGTNLAIDAPSYRLVSRRVLNFIMRHASPPLAYRHLPATGGFQRRYVVYRSSKAVIIRNSVWHGVETGVQLLLTTTTAPMRLVMMLSLFGAIADLLYSFYVIGVAIFKNDVAPGWVTLSLQQSGMFFLIVLVLLVLGEYVLLVSARENESPKYHIASEFNSKVIGRRQRLNVEDSTRTSER